MKLFQELCSVQQTFNSIKIWNYLQPGKDRVVNPLKSTSVSACFRGLSRLPAAFVLLRWFKLAHIFIQVCTFHDVCKQGIHQQIFKKFADRFLAYTHRAKYIVEGWLTITQDFLKGFPLKKKRYIQCYNCRGWGYLMKNCPYSPGVIMRERRELTTELKCFCIQIWN